ncbi:hypothetical protein ABQF26_40180, partial [Mycolicibacterium elephantis]
QVGDFFAAAVGSIDSKTEIHTLNRCLSRKAGDLQTWMPSISGSQAAGARPAGGDCSRSSDVRSKLTYPPNHDRLSATSIEVSRKPLRS